jgi:hypothetical protein
MKVFARISAASIFLLLLVGCKESGEAAGINGVKGLTPEISAMVNGVWEYVRSGGKQEKVEQWKTVKMYSWGKGKYAPNFSVVIDLGATPPIIEVPGLAYVKVLRVKSTGLNQLTFLTEDIPQDASPGTPTITVRFGDNGVMVFQGNIGGVPTDPENWTFERYYGPANPLP